MTDSKSTSLSPEERRFVALLGLPMLGITLAVTMAAAYAPVLLAELSGALVIGLLIGLEGLFALILPPLLGAWSDRLETPLGSRLPFLAGAALLGGAALCLIGLVGESVLVIGLLLALFFVAYHAYTTPYWAMFPDLVPDAIRGRSVGSMGFWRAIGMGIALVGGGVMLALWEPLPFLVSAAVLVAVTAVFVPRAARLEARQSDAAAGPAGGQLLGAARELIAEHPAVRAVLVANALWECAIGALRAFAVLFLTVGLGYSLELTSAVMGLVAVTALAAAPLAGVLADRWGELRLLRLAIAVFGIGLLLPLVTTSPLVGLAVPLIAAAAVTVMTLPLSVLMGVLPEGNHGSAAGLFAMSRGVGLLLGPALAGAAIVLLEPVFEGTEGYAAMFAVASLAVLASLPLLGRIAGAGADGLEPS